MATEIIMPKLSDTMTEGQLGAWRKSVGQTVERGEIIAEVETDKAVMELEAFASGILLEQRVQPGQLVPVGTVIGLIGGAGEADTAPQPVAAAQTPGPAAMEPPVSTAVPPEHGAPSGPQAAPIVRRRAAELGIDLASVEGSGPGGRIMLEDLERPGVPAAPRDAQQPSASPPPAGATSRMRSAIARTTSDAWRTIPHFYLTLEIEMEQAEAAVRRLKDDGVAVSLNGVIMTALAQALTAFPALTSAYGEQGVVSRADVHLSFAVALPDGLQMPVIRNAETKGVRDVTAEAKQLAERARQGQLTLEQISGGSFSVSNLGMYGVDSLASIVMPGQGGILGLGMVAERPVVRDGKVVAARTMKATLACDHRIIDGAVAAPFLNEFKRLLEHPAELPA